MKIGFDLDKIFIDTPMFVPDKLIDKFYKQRDNGVLLYRIPGKFEQQFRKITHLPFLRQPIKKNISILKKIPKKTNKLYLISSRYKFLETLTNKIIHRYGLTKIFDQIFFNFENKQPHLFKNTILKQLKLDIYVDDDLSLLKYVAQYNPQTKFFWFNHAHKKINLPKNIIAIKDLNEIFNKP